MSTENQKPHDHYNGCLHRVFEQGQHPFLKKKKKRRRLNKLHVQGTYLTTLKAVYGKHCINAIINGRHLFLYYEA
jgi:hypothetical protein